MLINVLPDIEGSALKKWGELAFLWTVTQKSKLKMKGYDPTVINWIGEK